MHYYANPFGSGFWTLPKKMPSKLRKKCPLPNPNVKRYPDPNHHNESSYIKNSLLSFKIRKKITDFPDKKKYFFRWAPVKRRKKAAAVKTTGSRVLPILPPSHEGSPPPHTYTHEPPLQRCQVWSTLYQTSTVRKVFIVKSCVMMDRRQRDLSHSCNLMNCHTQQWDYIFYLYKFNMSMNCFS